MSICDNCIHLNVCGHEGVEDEGMKYCADKEERPNEYEWCKGCKEHDAENHCCHRLSNFIHTQAQEIHDMAYEEGKNARTKGEWIPVSERLPDDLKPVNITWINHEPLPYYQEIKGEPFTATAVYFNGQWYWWSTSCTDTLAEYSNNFNDIIDTAIEVIAWQPLPEPYKEGGAVYGELCALKESNHRGRA